MGYSEWVLPKDGGEAGLLLLGGTQIGTDVEWPCGQSQSIGPGSKTEEWSSHEVWGTDRCMELPVLLS